jgi:aminoglycoside phosphotransferase (APT) family kinase protein
MPVPIALDDIVPTRADADPAGRAPLVVIEPLLEFRQPGFLRREELIARYEQIAGRRTTDIRWYQALAVWKAIVFMEGNYKRALAGTTDDPFLAAFGEGVMQLVSWAETLVSSQAETNT